MATTKRHRHTLRELLSYMQMLEDGKSFTFIHKKYGINAERLKVLWHRYQAKGVDGLQKIPQIKADYALKIKIVLDIEKNHLSFHAASLKYGASPQRISVWLHIVRTEGIQALNKCKKRGIPSVMGRPRKDSKPLTELEKLQKENQELKTEIALLKKVRALVEERNARLREIGHGPSKS